MKYRSKIGIWFHLTMLLITVGCIYPVISGIREDDSTLLIVGIVCSFLLLPFFYSIYLNTYYTLEEATLHIRCGMYMNKRIAYSDIESFYETKDPLASVALSLDRISVNYTKANGKSDEIYISPRNKQEFLRLLNEKMAEHSQPED